MFVISVPKYAVAFARDVADVQPIYHCARSFTAAYGPTWCVWFVPGTVEA